MGRTGTIDGLLSGGPVSAARVIKGFMTALLPGSRMTPLNMTTPLNIVSILPVRARKPRSLCVGKFVRPVSAALRIRTSHRAP